MIRRMRAHGVNVFEAYLGSVLNAFGWAALAMAAAALVFPAILPARSMADGLLVGWTASCGAVLLLAGGGVRRNRSAVDLAFVLLSTAAIAWLARGAAQLRWAPLAVGAAFLAAAVFARVIRREGVDARFNPRSLSERQFETLVRILDVLVDVDGRSLDAVELAVQADHMLAGMPAEAAATRRALVAAEWFLPLAMTHRPVPFSDLGTYEGRVTLERLVFGRGLMHRIASAPLHPVPGALDLLTGLPYLTSSWSKERIQLAPFRRRAPIAAGQPPAAREPRAGEGRQPSSAPIHPAP